MNKVGDVFLAIESDKDRFEIGAIGVIEDYKNFDETSAVFFMELTKSLSTTQRFTEDTDDYNCRSVELKYFVKIGEL